MTSKTLNGFNKAIVKAISTIQAAVANGTLVFGAIISYAVSQNGTATVHTSTQEISAAEIDIIEAAIKPLGLYFYITSEVGDDGTPHLDVVISFPPEK